MRFLKDFLNRARSLGTKRSGRVFPRVQVGQLVDVSFRFTDPAELGVQPLQNLSVAGMGFGPEVMGKGLKSGSTVRGILRIDQDEFPLVARVVYLNASGFGCRTEEAPVGLRERLLRHLVVEFAAVKMVAVRSEVLKAEPDGKPHFLMSANGCELFYVEKSGALVRFHLAFFGNYLEGTADGKLKGGFVEIENPWAEKPRFKGSVLIEEFSEVSPELLAAAESFLSNVTSLEPAIRSSIQERLASAV